MLLVFFLVTTSIITEQGLLRRLAPAPDEEQEEMVVDRSEMLLIAIAADDAITCDGEVLSMVELKVRVMAFVEEDPQRHVITIDADRAARYDTYFHVYQTIIEAYATLRARRAMEEYGRSYRDCTAEERQAIAAFYPQHLSDSSSTEEGGER